FIQMKNRRRNLQVVQQAHAANSQSHFLHETRFAIAAVKMTGNQSIDLFIVADVGVQQVERNPADVCLPDARLHGSTAHIDFNKQRNAFASPHQFQREFADVAFAISFLLPALRIDALLEIAIAIKQTDSNQRQIQIARRLQMVARQNAQAAGIKWQRAMDAELRTKIGDWIDTVDRRIKSQSRRNASVRYIRIETLG